MNKKQVTAFLKVMGKDKDRKILMNAKVDRYNNELCLVATNGLLFAVVFIDSDADILEGKLIRRDALEKWAKLATGRSRLTGAELVTVSADDYADHNGYNEDEYPEWRHIIPTGKAEGQQQMIFNAELFKVIQDLDGEDRLVATLYGAVKPMTVRTERGIYIAMPMYK